MRRGNRQAATHGNRPRFWGRHAVIAALANPERVVRKIWGTREALGALELPPVLPITYADVADLGRMVPSDAPKSSRWTMSGWASCSIAVLKTGAPC